MKIEIGNKEYNVEVAYTDNEKETGLKNINYMPNDE